MLMLEGDFFPSRQTSQCNLPIPHLHACKQNGNGKPIWETHTICNITTTNGQFCSECFGLIYRSMSPFILRDSIYRLHVCAVILRHLNCKLCVRGMNYLPKTIIDYVILCVQLSRTYLRCDFLRKSLLFIYFSVGFALDYYTLIIRYLSMPHLRICKEN